MDGYWRSDSGSLELYPCLEGTACLGPTEEEIKYGDYATLLSVWEAPLELAGNTAVCEEGYEGNLCHKCVLGYSRSGSASCDVCPDKASRWTYFFFGAIAFFGGFSILLW